MCSTVRATSPAAGALELLVSGSVRDCEVSPHGSEKPRCLAGGASLSLWGPYDAVGTAFLDCHSQGNRWGSSRAKKSSSARAREFLTGEYGRQEVFWRRSFLDHTIRRADRRGREGSCSSTADLSLNGNWKSRRLNEQLDYWDMQMARHGPISDWSSPDDDGGRGIPGYERSVTGETVRQLCEQGQLVQAIEALGVLVKMHFDVSKFLLYIVLRRCLVERNLVHGRRAHALAVKGGYELDKFLCNHILRMYAGHARLQEGMDVFAGIAEPDAFMWSSVISAHVKQGRDKEAIELYHRMRRLSVKPDGHVFVAALQACARGADLETGQQVHADVLATGSEPDLFVSSCLVDMYAKCESLEDAQRVFDTLGEKNVVTWTALITGYAQQGMGQQALHLYSAMREEGAAIPDSVTFVSLLQACASVGAPALEKGKQLHAHIREQGYQGIVFVASSLVNMYAKCGSLKDAHIVFNGLTQKNVVTWTALIAGYSQQGMGQEALRLYSAMQEEGLAVPDSVTFVCLLQACTRVGNLALDKGKQLHAQIRDRGFQGDEFVASSLVNMYAKCGSLEDAEEVFHSLDQKNVVTWSSMIAGYSQQGMGLEALRLYRAIWARRRQGCT